MEAWRFFVGCLGLLVDPRVWLLMVLAAAGGFLKGCADERERFDAYEAKVSTLGEAAIKHTQDVRAQHAKILKENTDGLKKSTDSLRSQLATAKRELHDARSREGSGNTPAAPIVEGSGQRCWDAAELDRRMEDVRFQLRQDFVAETEPFIKRGAEAAAALTACVESWQRLHDANPDTSE